MSIEEARAGLRSGPDTNARFAWVIADDDDRLVGGCRLYNVDLQHRSARFAIGLVDPARLGQGFGSEATLLVVAHAFDDLGLHRVDLVVLADNVRAVRAYEKAGFRTEGRLRQTLWRDGRWHDDLLLAILAPEYAERRGRPPDASARNQTDQLTEGS